MITFIQWKGTDLCMDFYCDCGGQSHFDGMFAYAIKCPDCGTFYEMPTNIPLKEIPFEKAKEFSVLTANKVE